MLLTDFPNEILCKIAFYLPFDDLFQLERINKQFYNILKTYTWPEQDTFDHKSIVKRHKLNDKSIKIIFSRAPLIHTLDLSVYRSTITYQVTSTFNLIPQLLFLNLSYIRLTNNSLRTIARYCPLLEKVVFEECFRDSKVEKGLEILFKKCPNIKYLNFSGNDMLFGESFEFIPVGIYHINLENCFNISEDAMNLLYLRATNLEPLCYI